MTKTEAIQLHGGTQKALAAHLQISQPAVCMWPDELPVAFSDRVIGAAVRLGILRLAANVEEKAA